MVVPIFLRHLVLYHSCCLSIYLATTLRFRTSVHVPILSFSFTPNLSSAAGYRSSSSSLSTTTLEAIVALVIRRASESAAATAAAHIILLQVSLALPVLSFSVIFSQSSRGQANLGVVRTLRTRLKSPKGIGNGPLHPSKPRLPVHRGVLF